MASLARGTVTKGILVSSNHSQAKIRDACMTIVIYKDVWLTECLRNDEIRFGKTTYPFEVPMNNIAGVEVAEALSDVR